jgi:hypothetical protein
MKMRVKLKGTRLTALRFVEVNPNGKAIYLFKCDCGNLVSLRRDMVQTGNTRSCGCLRKEKTRETGRANAGMVTTGEQES